MRWKSLLLSSIAALLLAGSVEASGIILGWDYTQDDANPATSFKLYFQPDCTGPFLWVAHQYRKQLTGSFTQEWIATLNVHYMANTLYCVVATALNDDNEESVYSNTIQIYNQLMLVSSPMHLRVIPAP